MLEALGASLLGCLDHELCRRGSEARGIGIRLRAT
jgi:hypothetical protein